MDTKQDGGPAFPVDNPSGHHPGMSLRDYFAGQALAGELAAQSSETGEWASVNFRSLAERSYAIADAMLAEREKRA